MNRNYKSIREISQLFGTSFDLPHWAASHETSLAIAAALQAIASGDRSPQAIWEAPTAAEVDHIKMAVAEYRLHRDFEPADEREEAGWYLWGEEKLFISPFPVGARVEGGDTVEDYDTGKVIAIEGDEITVAWSNGTRTTQPSSVLRPEGSNPHRN